MTWSSRRSTRPRSARVVSSLTRCIRCSPSGDEVRHGVARCGQNCGHAALQRPTKGLERLTRLGDYHPSLLRLRLPTRGIRASCPQRSLITAAISVAALLAEQVADLSEQLNVDGSGGAGLLTALLAYPDHVHRQHDHEVDHQCHQHKIEWRGSPPRRPLGGVTGNDGEAPVPATGRSDRVDQRLDDLVGER